MLIAPKALNMHRSYTLNEVFKFGAFYAFKLVLEPVKVYF